MAKFLIPTFLISFLMSLGSFHYFANYLAAQELESDAELLLNQFHGEIYDAKLVLEKLSSTVGSECGIATKRFLQDMVYKTPAIRWLGVSNSKGMTCRSSSTSFEEDNFDTHTLGDGYSIISILDEWKQTDMILVKKFRNRTYYADLDPFVSNYINGFNCIGCIGYRIVIKGEPELVYKSDNYEDLGEIERSMTRYNDDIATEITLRGNEEFFSHFSLEGNIWAVIISVFISILVVLGVRILLIARQSFERVIQNAIDRNEFVPFYQPFIDSRTNELIGAEVLIRWIKPDGKMVPPAEFIPFAEENGQIVPITNYLLNAVAKDIVKFGWNGTNRFASINIVPEHLNSNQLLEEVIGVVNGNKIEASNLSLEITERKQIRDLKQARVYVNRFRDLGIEIKLDDAGTGYGGFSYVQELGISALKIDKMFIDSLTEENDVKTPVVDAIASFAKSSNLELIAEGVESKEQVDELAKRGIYIIQGYYYARPMSAQDMMIWQTSSEEKNTITQSC